jgi:hypothetical protein
MTISRSRFITNTLQNCGKPRPAFQVDETTRRFFMERLMGTIDAALVVADVIEAFTAFFRRKAVRQLGRKSQRLAQATILVSAMVITLLVWLSICAIKTMYQSWATALPVAIAEFQAGYDAMEAQVAVSEAVDAIAEITPASVPTKTISRVQQRRQQCQAAGIQWRNAHGKHKHLTMQEMQAALEQL